MKRRKRSEILLRAYGLLVYDVMLVRAGRPAFYDAAWDQVDSSTISARYTEKAIRAIRKDKEEERKERKRNAKAY